MSLALNLYGASTERLVPHWRIIHTYGSGALIITTAIWTGNERYHRTVHTFPNGPPHESYRDIVSGAQADTFDALRAECHRLRLEEAGF